MVHRESPHDVTFSSFLEETDHAAVEETPPVYAEEIAKEKENELQNDDIHDPPYSLIPLTTMPPYWNDMNPPFVKVNLIHRGNPMWVNLLLDAK